MKSTLSVLYDGTSKDNTSVIELTNKDYKRLQDNCITLGGISKHGNIVSYEKISYGKGLSIKKKTIDIGKGKDKYRYIDLNKSKGRFMLIITDKDDCQRINTNTHAFCSRMTIQSNIKNDNSNILSGKIVLMLAILPAVNAKNDNKKSWDDSIYGIARACKPNCLKTYDHFGSKGFTYSFGNKPLYGNVNGSSVAIYATTKSKNIDKQKVINDKATYLDNLCSISMNTGISYLSKIIPETSNLLSPIVDAAEDKQNISDIHLLQKNNSSDNGLWNSHLHVNGRTELYHTESDCAYTYITVPNQNRDATKLSTEKPYFYYSRLPTKFNCCSLSVTNYPFSTMQGF